MAALRWAVNIHGWEPGEAEWEFLLARLTGDERERTCRFVFRDDQKRALVSRLLQRRCCEEALRLPAGVPFPIGHTKGGKPFVKGSVRRPPFAPNFNFNVSHEGAWVVLASEPLLLVGVDVAAPRSARAQRSALPGSSDGTASAQAVRADDVMGLERLFDSMAGSFSPAEWAFVRSGCSAAAQERFFRQLWSLKEAYIKARGDGLAFSPLARAEFRLERRTDEDDCVVDGGGGDDQVATTACITASARVDGKELVAWSFALHQLPGDHWVAVARGPPNAAVDAWGEFTATMASHPLTTAGCAAAHAEPRGSWEMLQVGALLPAEHADGYKQARERDCVVGTAPQCAQPPC